MKQIREPIIILGSPRSGTTMLGNLLASHPDVAYWEEPRPIWSQGHAWRDDDRLVAADLTPDIARRIDHRFSRFLADSGKSRFAEKTPGNTLRLPFIQALYPDAKIIHLMRDGRAVVASMLRLLEKPPDGSRILARLRETPPRDLPALAPLFFRDVVAPRLTGRSRKTWWGPRPPGWREWRDLPVPTRLARQWLELVTPARRELREHFPADQWIELRYEDFIADPEIWLTKIGQTVGVRIDETFLGEVIPGIDGDPGKIDLSPDARSAVESVAGDLLRELGYLAP